MTLFDPNAEPDEADVYHIRFGEGQCVAHTVEFHEVAKFVAAEGGASTFEEVARNVWTAIAKDGRKINITKTIGMKADTWLD